MGRLSEPQAAAGLGRLIDRPAKPYQLDMIAQLSQRADDGHAYADPIAAVLAPRQVGKTLTTFLLQLARMHTRRGYAAAYTAQTGIVVTQVFCNPGNGWLTLIEGDQRLADRYRTTRSMGREMIISRGNPGAYLRAFPPTPGRLRSTSLDCVMLDECQEHSQEVGQALMADIGPVLSTRPRRQIILMGTAPQDAAAWWADQIERGRQGLILLVEVGTWPDGADPEDPATWRAHHPGLRHGLTDEAYLRSQLATLGVERFAREYGNRIPGGASLDTPLHEGLWRRAQHDGAPPAVPLVIGFDVAPDRSAAAVVAVGRLPDGRTCAGVVALEPGTDWLPARLLDLKRRWPRVRLVSDGSGPAADAIDAVRRERVDVATVDGADRLTAHGHLVSELDAGRAAVMPHPAMEDARRCAKRRWTDAGGWVFSRRRSTGDISPLTAWTWAQWAARTKPGIAPRVVASARRDAS
jgi:hypothetical protein